MRNAISLVSACLLLLLCASALSATVFDDSLAALRARPEPGDGFTFAVIADLHTGLDPAESADLRANLQEVSWLHPELVLACGDLIQGKGPETLEKEWAFSHADSAVCGVPFFPTPGNHDLAGPEMAQIWQRLNSPLQYSFDWGGCHFISLNAMQKGGIPAQLDWLKADLAAAKAKHIFVFFHSPDWAEDPPRWQQVHDVLRQYPVRMVFAGHWHHYLRFEPRDGIQYLALPAINGRSATPEGLARGRFNGYLLVKVQGDRVDYSLMAAGGVVSPDISTERAMRERERLLREAVQVPKIAYTFGQALDRKVTLTVTNPSPRPLTGILTCQTPGKWQVSPKSARYEVPAGGSVPVEFRIAAPADGVMYPTPTFRTAYRYGQDLENEIPVSRSLWLSPRFAVPHANQPPTIDGRLDEWRGIPAIPLAYAERISIKETSNLSGKVQLQWDQGTLYMAVTVRDNVFYQPYTEGGVWQADALEMTFDTKADGNDTDHRADDCDFSMAKTTSGPQPWVARDAQGFEGRADDIRLAVERQGNYTLYEIAFPASRLNSSSFAAGRHMGFSLAAQDMDGPSETKRHWWVETLPGIGGGDLPCPLYDLVLR